MREFNSALWYSQSLRNYSCLQSRMKTFCNQLWACAYWQKWKNENWNEISWLLLSLHCPTGSGKVLKKEFCSFPSQLFWVSVCKKRHLRIFLNTLCACHQRSFLLWKKRASLVWKCTFARNSVLIRLPWSTFLGQCHTEIIGWQPYVQHLKSIPLICNSAYNFG